MFIMGLGGSDHDVSVTIMSDEFMVCALEEERVTRKKYGFNSNLLYGHARKYVLEKCGLSMDDIELIVADDILPASALFSLKGKYQKVNHHLLHAASTFFPSPFQDAAIMVVDNAGSLVDYKGQKGIETLTYATGHANEIIIQDKIISEKYKTATIGKTVYQAGDPNDSLGHFYKLISHYAGFDFIVNEDFYFTEDGKTMGLAPYGKDDYYSDLRPYLKLENNGKFKIDLLSGDFEKILKSIMEKKVTKEEDFKRRANLCYAGQKILEEALVHCALHLYESTGLKKLCIAGGVGLNSVANGKILQQTPFEEIFVQPASGDNGTSLGAAMYGHFVINKGPRNLKESDDIVMKNAYLGPSYTKDEIEKSLHSEEFKGKIKLEQPENILEETAELIEKGNIIAFFQGGCEYGPRALGHRSLLADPRRFDMKDIMNKRVKFREGFRPFAPSVMFEHQKDYFDLDQYSPFMLIVCDVKEEKRKVIPAVTHVDGTARVQSVKEEDSPQYHALINEFYKKTGVPVLLNTSFNIKGMPIVETPVDALRCFIQTGIDYLIIDDYLVHKLEGEQK